MEVGTKRNAVHLHGKPVAPQGEFLAAGNGKIGC
jgi:hypothetical protein